MKLPKTDIDGGSVMETQRLKQAVILKGSPKGFFNPVIPRVFWQPTPQLRPAHTVNPESRDDFALKSRIPSVK